MKVFVAAALLLSSFVAGCTSSSDGGLEDTDADDLGLEVAPVLYLNLTIANETHRFSTAPAAPTGANASSPATTASGNSSSGSSTGAGNATGGNATAGAGAGSFGGPAPLDVSATLGASGLPANGSVRWTLDFGEAAAEAGNATAGNGTAKAAGPANGTKVPATVDHTYASAGTYDVSLSFQVGNGTRQVLRASLTVTAPAGNATNTTAAAPVPEPIVIEGSAFGNGVVVEIGNSEETFDVVGLAATMTITLEFSGPSGQDDLDWEVAGPGGESHGGANGGQEDPVTFDDPSEGTWTVTVIPWLTIGPVDYTITVTFT